MNTLAKVKLLILLSSVTVNFNTNSGIKSLVNSFGVGKIIKSYVNDNSVNSEYKNYHALALSSLYLLLTKEHSISKSIGLIAGILNKNNSWKEYLLILAIVHLIYKSNEEDCSINASYTECK